LAACESFKKHSERFIRTENRPFAGAVLFDGGTPVRAHELGGGGPPQDCHGRGGKQIRYAAALSCGTVRISCCSFSNVRALPKLSILEKLLNQKMISGLEAIFRLNILSSLFVGYYFVFMHSAVFL
jgi:hypothetical protein